MREQLPAQGVNHSVTNGRGDEDLRVGEKPSTHGNQDNGGRGFHYEHYFAAGHKALEKMQRMRQRLTQESVIHNDLQRPRLQQLGGTDPDGAQARQEQTPFDLTKVREENLAEPRSFFRLHDGDFFKSRERKSSALGLTRPEPSDTPAIGSLRPAAVAQLPRCSAGWSRKPGNGSCATASTARTSRPAPPGQDRAQTTIDKPRGCPGAAR